MPVWDNPITLRSAIFSNRSAKHFFERANYKITTENLFHRREVSTWMKARSGSSLDAPVLATLPIARFAYLFPMTIWDASVSLRNHVDKIVAADIHSSNERFNPRRGRLKPDFWRPPDVRNSQDCVICLHIVTIIVTVRCGLKNGFEEIANSHNLPGEAKKFIMNKERD